MERRRLRLGLERPRGRVGIEHVARGRDEQLQARLAALQGRGRRRRRLDQQAQPRLAVARPSETPVGVRREEPAPVRRVRDRLEAPRAVDHVAARKPPSELYFVLVVVAEGVADRRDDDLRSQFQLRLLVGGEVDGRR